MVENKDDQDRVLALGAPTGFVASKALDSSFGLVLFKDFPAEISPHYFILSSSNTQEFKSSSRPEMLLKLVQLQTHSQQCLPGTESGSPPFPSPSAPITEQQLQPPQCQVHSAGLLHLLCLRDFY